MSPFERDHILERAGSLLDNGHVDQAIHILTTLLGEDPEDADAHALLAISLVRRKRLHAARLEATRASELNPESPFAHLANGVVLTARREFAAAERSLLGTLEIDPESDSACAQLARLYLAWNKPSQAKEYAGRALALAPDRPDHQYLLGWIDYEGGDRIAARQHAQSALEIDPEYVDALVLMGLCLLADGDTDAAREHAAWALRNDPMNEGTLTLLAGVKARKSPLLGLWWRFQAFVSSGSGKRTITLLVGFYLVYRIALVALDQRGLKTAATGLSFAWLGFCAYTWFAPTLFFKSVKRELETVRLRPDY